MRPCFLISDSILDYYLSKGLRLIQMKYPHEHAYLATMLLTLNISYYNCTSWWMDKESLKIIQAKYPLEVEIGPLGGRRLWSIVIYSKLTFVGAIQ